jgi:organic hydroperoxide reductase OsmC/OhrA
MHPFPHRYVVSAAASPAGHIVLSSAGLTQLPTAAPAEFDGPGNQWSPETLLVAAVADCFALTFRGIAKVSNLNWSSLSCEVDGTLERPERVTRFTQFTIHATLVIPDERQAQQARRILVRAEETCLITRSLNAKTDLDLEVEVAVGAMT